MSITRTIGKNTLGDNNKMKVNMRTYNRSTHDMSYVWRNTQAVGTLVPFMCEVALPGDTHEIKLEANVMTHPTVGPLFGSFKLQMDVFSCPIRLYNAKLHNNTLGVGLNIKSVKLPQMKVTIAANPKHWVTANNEFTQINPSCLLSYLGLRGHGLVEVGENNADATRNAVPLLSYWDIFKNYYANKQETNAYYIGNLPAIDKVESVTPTGEVINKWERNIVDIDIVKDYRFRIFPKTGSYLTTSVVVQNRLTGSKRLYNVVDLAIFADGGTFSEWKFRSTMTGYSVVEIVNSEREVKLEKFPLENVDKMRENILRHDGNTPFYVEDTANTVLPYRAFTMQDNGYLKTGSKQFGLAIKTYNSDIMQNWINTDWIDGNNGINAISAVDVSDGKFTMDALNLAGKVYDMLNRIAISGGSYSDWIETVFTNEFHMNTETPVYEGGASQEIVFQEVVSNSATSEEPLGSLAGRGRLSGRQKGGFIKVRTKEPAYLMGIVSITPRIDYSQGNRFDTLFETLDDLHKPALDGIGYQDLITDKMAWWDTRLDGSNKVFKSAGKQPAWLDYMTNYNRTFGAFADRYDEAFMVLNRSYEGADEYDHANIKDLTTYIDPVKFNYIFADTKLDAMNFWVQIGVDIKARRMISAKMIPNL